MEDNAISSREGLKSSIASTSDASLGGGTSEEEGTASAVGGICVGEESGVLVEVGMVVGC